MTDEAQTARLRRWQAVTVATLFTGYAGYYVCRSNLSVATPLLLDEYGAAGLTKAHIGDVASVGVLFYAIGKLLNGVAAEYVGGKRIFLFGMFASVACTVLFALSPRIAGPLAGVAGEFGLPVAVLVPFFGVWAANRFVQSMGWGGLVQITARWFTAGRLATVMGVLCMSYLLGDAVARFYLGAVVKAGLGWQGVFFTAAATLGLIGLVSLFTLKGRPARLGLPEPPPPPGNVYGDDAGHEKVSLGKLLAPLLTSFTFWLVCLMNVGLTLIRETFNLWNPTYLKEVVKLDAGTAGMASLVFPLLGAVSSVLAGWLVDRLNGRYGLVVVSSLVGLVAALGALAWLPLEGQTWLALVLIGAVAFFLLAPYTFCSGVLAVKLGGQRGGSTAAGIIDTAGYLGATLAGSGVGRIADSYGWGTAFAALASVAVVTMVVAGVYALRTPPDVPPPPEPETDANYS
ncbi:MAG: MFS transporter [Planctomycetes bacterium]|nr:MFS transporter [Planctomycetota bacterium]